MTQERSTTKENQVTKQLGNSGQSAPGTVQTRPDDHQATNVEQEDEKYLSK